MHGFHHRDIRQQYLGARDTPRIFIAYFPSFFLRGARSNHKVSIRVSRGSEKKTGVAALKPWRLEPL